MLRYILNGGPLMWVLLVLSTLGLAIIIDRWKTFRLADMDTSTLRKSVRKLLSEGKVDEAIGLCREMRGPVAAILFVGLIRYQKLLKIGAAREELDTSVSESMQDYAPHVISALEKRVSLLLMVGSISPLIGMTGTVLGMIKAFGAMATQGLGGQIVAAGMKEALITTAAGLLLAVPAVVFYNFFSNKVEQHTLRIEEAASELVEFIHLWRSGSRSV